LDTTGYSGTGGSQNVYSTAAQAASPLPVGGTLGTFVAHAGSPVAASGVTLTVLRNGSPTSVTCTIAAGQSSCSDVTHTVAVAASDTVAVEIQNGSGTFVRNVAWVAQVN
jgi:hypothetical protein